MRAEGQGRQVVWVLLLGLLGSVGGCDAFCARQTFDEARLGQPWDQVHGAARYALNGQLAFYSIDGPGDQEGTDYYVVLTDDGKVMAKAYSIAGHATAFGLQIEARHWAELKEVASHYPYYKDDAQGLLEPVYPPLIRPWSKDDKVLPSGVRQSTWASLTHFFWGWPFQTQQTHDERWFRETQVRGNGKTWNWPDVAQAMDRLPTEGVLTVFWGRGPLSP